MVVVATAGAGFTVSLNGADVESSKLLLPPNSTVMVLVPATSDAVDKVATPAPFKEAVPRITALLRKETVPFGVPPDGATTVAVKMTAFPAVTGLEEAWSVVIVAAPGAGFTVRDKAGDVAVAYVASPK